MITLIPVKTARQQQELAVLADHIWKEYWPSRIGQAQTDYMVEQFQSLEAITHDMAENDYEYWFAVAHDEPGFAEGAVVGFTGGHDEPETDRFFISKIYLLEEARGHHFASAVIRFYNDLCASRGWRAMYLTVNKYNEMGIRCYEAKGFETIECVETDIGHGFIMDDFIMERQTQRA